MKLLPEITQGRMRAIVVCTVVAALATLGVSAAAMAAPAKTAAAKAKDHLIMLEEEVAPSIDMDGANGAQPQTQEIIDNLMDPLVTYSTKLKNGILVPMGNQKFLLFGHGRKGNRVFRFSCEPPRNPTDTPQN